MPIDIINLVKSVSREATRNIEIADFTKQLESRLKMEQYTIDRFEGDFAVCEEEKTGKMVNIRKTDIPAEAKEGSIIVKENNQYKVDNEKTNQVAERIKKKMDNLWEN